MPDVEETPLVAPETPAPRGGYRKLAYVALGMLTIQNCGAVLLMRYTRFIPSCVAFI